MTTVNRAVGVQGWLENSHERLDGSKKRLHRQWAVGYANRKALVVGVTIYNYRKQKEETTRRPSKRKDGRWAYQDGQHGNDNGNRWREHQNNSQWEDAPKVCLSLEKVTRYRWPLIHQGKEWCVQRGQQQTCTASAGKTSGTRSQVENHSANRPNVSESTNGTEEESPSVEADPPQEHQQPRAETK